MWVKNRKCSRRADVFRFTPESGPPICCALMSTRPNPLATASVKLRSAYEPPAARASEATHIARIRRSRASVGTGPVQAPVAQPPERAWREFPLQLGVAADIVRVAS